MNSRFHFDGVSHTLSMRWILSLGWVLILAKCVLVWWAIRHWSVPVNPAIVIVPTLLAAAAATVLWLTHQED